MSDNEVNLSGSGSIKSKTIKRIESTRKSNRIKGLVREASIVGLVLTVWMSMWFVIAKMGSKTITRTTVTIVEQPSIPDVIDDVRGSVVHIGKVGICQGSGVMVSDQIVMTARHVTDGDSTAEYVVTFDDLSTQSVRMVIEDMENDISYLLLSNPVDVNFSNLAESNPRVGEAVIVFGSPLGYEQFNTASPGYVTALKRELYEYAGQEAQYLEWHQMIQSNAPAYPGNSGGPVFNMNGEISGVLVAGMDATLNWSVPVSRIYGSLEKVSDIFKQALIEDRFKVLVEDTTEDYYDQEYYDYCEMHPH